MSKEERAFAESKTKFFGCTDKEWQERQEFLATHKPIDPKTLVKTMFVLNKKESMPRKLMLQPN